MGRSGVVENTGAFEDYVLAALGLFLLGFLLVNTWRAYEKAFESKPVQAERSVDEGRP
jgi:hypothetical protein